jgi:hypothetical protein
MPAAVGARSGLRLAKSLLCASNCINTIHGVTPASGYVVAARMRLLYHGHAAAVCRYALRLTGDPVRSEISCRKRYCAWEHPEVSSWTGANRLGVRAAVGRAPCGAVSLLLLDVDDGTDRPRSPHPHGHCEIETACTQARTAAFIARNGCQTMCAVIGCRGIGLAIRPPNRPVCLVR